MKRISLPMTLAFVCLSVPRVQAGAVYNAVADFSISSNPNGQWSYLYNNGSGLQLLTQPIVLSDGIDYWWDGMAIPNDVATLKNTTNSTVSASTRVLPPNLLGMEPESATDVIRWTAPTAGNWSITGLFQGIDTSEHSHNVEILENSGTQILAPTSISFFGQQVSFDATVTLAKGDTIDFIVQTGSTYTDLSTGLTATIQNVPEPSTITLAAIGGMIAAGYFRCRCRSLKR